MRLEDGKRKDGKGNLPVPLSRLLRVMHRIATTFDTGAKYLLRPEVRYMLFVSFISIQTVFRVVNTDR